MAVHVGDRGVTESPLYLTGSVRINGIRVIARSDRGPVEAGTAVVVVGDDPMGVVVRPLESGRETERLPDHGRPVFTSPEERAAAVEERQAAEVQQSWTVHRQRGIVFGALAGMLAAGVALGFLWGRIDQQSLSPEAFAGVIVVGGAVWGALLFLLVDGGAGSGEPGMATVVERIHLFGVGGYGVRGGDWNTVGRTWHRASSGRSCDAPLCDRYPRSASRPQRVMF